MSFRGASLVVGLGLALAGCSAAAEPAATDAASESEADAPGEGSLAAGKSDHFGQTCLAPAVAAQLTTPIESRICQRLDKLGVLRRPKLGATLGPWPSWFALKAGRCTSYVKSAEGYRAAVLEPAGGELQEECFGAAVSQRRCRENLDQDDPCQGRTSCIEGQEIACQSFVPPEVRAAQQADEPVYPTIQSRCTSVTVGRIGYARHSTHKQRIDACTADNSHNLGVGTCEFLGHQIKVDRGFCKLLEECVEPKIAQRFEVLKERPAPTGVYRTYGFPSGAQELRVELSCGSGAASWSNHHPAQGCRALDINVHENQGNLSLGTVSDPEATLAPAFVAAMEECGLVWGGRFNAAENKPHGCDPMHFDYAPACAD